MPNCSICEKPAIARGLCRKHYYRVQRRGLPPLETDQRTRPIKDRLLEKVIVSETGCWLFEGALAGNGYGLIWLDGKNQATHRVSYSVHRGPVADDDVICHRCDVRNCINPEHLFKGTRADNNADKTMKGRQTRGVMCHNAKLTDGQIRSILAATGTQTAIAKQFNVNQSQISRIQRGKRWKHLTSSA